MYTSGAARGYPKRRCSHTCAALSKVRIAGECKMTKISRHVSFEDRFNYQHTKTPTCWLWTVHTHKQGYGKIKKNGVSMLAHRASWEFHNGPIPPGMCVCHKCDNPPCVNPAHLFLGTHADNTADMYSKGRNVPPRGERNSSAKLTWVKVAEIRKLKGVVSQRAVAKQFGVTQCTISCIQSGKTWKEEDYDRA